MLLNVTRERNRVLVLIQNRRLLYAPSCTSARPAHGPVLGGLKTCLWEIIEVTERLI